MQKERVLLIEHLKLSKRDKDEENAKVTLSYLKSYLTSLSKGFYMIYKRENYLNKIRGFYDDNEMIKVITGVRRCGKSSLILSIIEELKAKGVNKDNIISIDLDSMENKDIDTPDKLQKKIDKESKAKGLKYLFIDEVQNVNNFEKLVNAYRESGEYTIVEISKGFTLIFLSSSLMLLLIMLMKLRL